MIWLGALDSLQVVGRLGDDENDFPDPAFAVYCCVLLWDVPQSGRNNGSVLSP